MSASAARRTVRNRASPPTGVSWLLPDGDVLRALGGERGAIPVGPAFAQPQAGELSHEVELAGGGRAKRHRDASPGSVDEREVVGDESLCVGVVLVHADMRLA